ncbi:MAG: DNA mismatch endonuclease patch repair protein [Ignavibacteria bacterium]|nr:MAG: DNA mismatch endonuclease patch repair protein [Ignavibacteria bacterium]KAF0161538.1 MAG: DNA mismatch endonuclease patch repair protein [Ignavibacteria bacterium]
MDNLTPAQRKKNMQNIRSKGTIPEKIIMRELKNAGIYFSTHANNIIGSPDIVFRRKKIVVFIDSDFWHKHPTRFIMPQTNTNYWINKINRNKQRDKIVTKELRKNGWRVIRLWGYDIKKSSSRCIKRILKEYNK